MRPRIALATLALLAGCAAQPAKIVAGPEQAPARAEAGPVTDLDPLPETLAGMARQGPPQRDTAPATQGSFLRYAGPGGIATVYLYTRDGMPPVDDAAAAVVTRELVLATIAASALHARAEAGDKPPPVPAWRSFMIQIGTARAGGTAPLRCAHAAVVLRDRPYDDFVCVTGLGGRLLKLRLTLARVPGTEGRAAGYVGAFAAAVLERLPGAVAPGPVPDAAPDGTPRPAPANPRRGNLLRT